MQSIDASTWLSQAAVEKLGWVLVHSFWQLTAVALLAWLFDRALRRRSSSVRYLSLLVALLLMIASPVVTWLMLPASLVDPVSAANPDSASIALDTPAQAANQEPAAPIEIAEVPTTGSLHKPVATSVSSGHWMNRCAEFLTPWLGTIVSVWSFGVLMFSIRPVVSWVNVQRLKRQGTSAVSDSVRHTLAMLSQKLKVRQRVDVLISTVVTSPIVVGCFRSVILLPASFIAGVPPAQLEAILAHELAHVKRYDYFVNLIQTLVETLSFYHPAVWWLSHRIRIERENCCDDMVVTALDNKVAYGRALLAIEEHRGQVSALALSANGGSLVARVRRLFSEPSSQTNGSYTGPVTLMALLLFVGITVSSRPTNARNGIPPENQAPSVGQDEYPKASFDDGKSVAIVGVRKGVKSAMGEWRPNGRLVVSPNSLWADYSNNGNESERETLFQWKGFAPHPSITWITDPVFNGASIGFQAEALHLRSMMRARDIDAHTEPTATVLIADDPWGAWVKVSGDAQVDGVVSREGPFARLYELVTSRPVTDPVAVDSGPAVEILRPANYQKVFDFEVTGFDNKGDEIRCREDFLHFDSRDKTKPRFKVCVFSLLGNMKPGRQFSHFCYRLRPYRYIATFRNFVISGPTDKATEVKVEAKKLTDSEILASLTSASLPQKAGEGNDESKLNDKFKADKNPEPPALKDQIVAAFKSDAELNERLILAKERAAGEDKRIAIVIAKPDSQQADWFYSLLQGTDDDLKRWKVDESAIKQIRQSLPRFQLLWVDVAQFDELRRLIPDHEFEDQHESSMVFLESDGSWLCHFEPDPTKEPRRSLENLGSAVDLHKEGKKNAGKLQGRIHLDGQAPRVPALKFPPGAFGNAKQITFVDESLLVGEKNGLANAFVYLKKAPAEWSESRVARIPAVVKVTPTGFSPRSSILYAGQDLIIDNTMLAFANAVLMPIKNQPYNIGIAPTKRELLKSPIKKRESLPFRLKSDIHPWMEGYVLALDHPFAAVSDSAGGFHIDNLPPGEHEFSVWHERVGFLKPLLVQIKGNETSTVDLPVSSDAFSKK